MMSPVKRIGLVLGAGGLTGQAFHAGVLAALAEATGWDPRHAAVIVGTSAGAGIGAYLRLGLSGPDLASMLSTEPMSDAGAELIGRLGPSGDWETPIGPATGAPHPRLLARAITRPYEIRPEAVLGVTFPPGRVPTESWAASLRALTRTEWPGVEWPAEPLWICTVRMDDARRVVFGRANAPTADVATAVAAPPRSPVTSSRSRSKCASAHGGVRLADERRRAPQGLDPSPCRRRCRRHARLALRQPAGSARPDPARPEVRRLRRRGIPVVVFQPARPIRRRWAATMDGERNAAVVRVRATTLRRLEHGRHADRPGMFRPAGGDLGQALGGGHVLSTRSNITSRTGLTRFIRPRSPTGAPTRCRGPARVDAPVRAAHNMNCSGIGRNPRVLAPPRRPRCELAGGLAGSERERPCRELRQAAFQHERRYVARRR